MAANKKLLLLPAFSHGLDPKATFHTPLEQPGAVLIIAVC